ncbi:MAG TPA: matrixin family metalloprotease [Deltaproteobacteria bacterium]|jgi:chromosome segregation ATPase|nr:matrixin family metalloprotease [Deltaproteobacteria bacterium]HQH99762.1 matrixin family metalloprotease [Deltaproteobacteria bacterium]HQJ08477.1 matrixin family metalloprotease [Deltaproteobacteria bacterium]
MSSDPSSTAAEFPNILPMRALSRRTGIPGLWRTVTWTLLILSFLTLMAVVYSRQQSPCRQPLTYRIGSVDPRFGLSSKDVSEAIREAAAVWNRASGRDLFREERKGDIVVNFIYDYRQEAADKLKGISGEIGTTKSSYDALNARFKNLEAEYKQKQAALSTDIDAYNERMSDFNAKSEAAASRKGGVPEGVYRELRQEKEALDSEYENLQTRQKELNDMADTLNSMVVIINEMAADLNLNVTKYNRAGERLRDEFSEGLYEKKNGRQSITIFHFTNRTRLVRVLAHELGHAMGIGHNNNPRALMYRMNQSDTLELASEDIASLKAFCGAR